MDANRKKHFERLMECMRDMKREASKLEETLGNTPTAEKVRRQLEEDISCARRLVYKTMYGELPPVDLPDNWEGDS
jgi:hypothetical protein